MKEERKYNYANTISYDGQRWRPIPCDNIYLISDMGKIWSVDSQQYLKPVKRDKKRGYLCVSLPYQGKWHNVAIHRLVAEAFIPNPENKPEVNHLDENKENNCVGNLDWATKAENANRGNRNRKISQSMKLYFGKKKANKKNSATKI